MTGIAPSTGRARSAIAPWILWIGLCPAGLAGAAAPVLSVSEAAAAMETTDVGSQAAAPTATPPPGPPGMARQIPRAGAAAPSPEVACYQSARAGSREPYPCDLAVQMGQDSGDSAALTAALTNRALVMTHRGRLDAALKDLDQALLESPGSPELHGNRGNLLLRMGRTTDALAAHDRAVRLAPEDPASYFNRAFCFLALGETARAQEDIDMARKLVARGSGFRPAQGSGAPVAPGR
jgi:tetratricopeptide (TPR) repeat protein